MYDAKVDIQSQASRFILPIMHFSRLPHRTSPNFSLPPDDGSLDIRQIIEYNGRQNADHPLYRYEHNGIQTISWGRAIKQFHRSAQLVLKNVALHEDSSSRVIAILANIDSITFSSLIIGIILAGYVPFPISKRNSVAAIVRLLASTGARYLYVSDDEGTYDLVTGAIHLLASGGSQEIALIPVPTFEDLSSDVEDGLPSLPPLLEIARDAPCAILHSSGSISFPKSITLTHRMVLQYGLLQRHQGINLSGEVLSAHSLPMYHLMGFLSIPLSSILGLTISFFPPNNVLSIPSADLVLSSAVETKSSMIFCVPSLLETWSSSPSSIAWLKMFSLVIFGGGPMKEDVGDLLFRSGVRMSHLLGLTETGPLTVFFPETILKEGWQWFQRTDVIKTMFIPEHGYDGVYRLIIQESTLHSPTNLTTIIDGVPSFDTKDLIIFHPENRNLFTTYGRADDQITHSTGEKTNPHPIEILLMKDQKISFAIMFGRSKFQAGVLVRPSSDYLFDVNDERLLEDYRNLIWDTVANVNRTSPQHSRIFKEMILVVCPEEPFETTAKGTVRRQAILTKYTLEIENIYAKVDDATLSGIPPLRSHDISDISTFVKGVVTEILQQQINEDDNIFRFGADSLAAISIRTSIVRTLQHSGLLSVESIRALHPDFIFLYPSIAKLSAYIHEAILMSHISLREVEEYEPNGLTFKPLPESNDTVVEITRGTTRKHQEPLILIHGAPGIIGVFAPLQGCTGPVWAIQVTNDTPISSIQTWSEFYMKKIKEKKPTGPYRLGAYSGSSLLLFFLVLQFEKHGDDVSELVLLDHFPTMILQGFDPEEVDTKSDIWFREFHEHTIKAITALCFRAKFSFGALMRQFGQFMMEVLEGSPSPLIGHLLVTNTENIMRRSMEFMFSDRFYVMNSQSGRLTWSRALFNDWMREVKAPITLYVATDGVLSLLGPELRDQMSDLGMLSVFPNAKVVTLDCDHFGILEHRRLLELL
ncbi:hypothetical protein BDQ12DRAFT_214647 [Crucibulum laeve]|uniref:Carrier domain-containing protein n=1 Tax=Crucibulum laeve TaxID=68775 RepID=A0A5C3LWZ0_9AGAR|nr:hypothetical protein BDQ12DRAFT_214647 [Crucibulum laeve]